MQSANQYDLTRILANHGMVKLRADKSPRQATAPILGGVSRRNKAT